MVLVALRRVELMSPEKLLAGNLAKNWGSRRNQNGSPTAPVYRFRQFTIFDAATLGFTEA